MPTKVPGHSGYSAFWREAVVRAELHKLKGLEFGQSAKVSGKAVHDLLIAYAGSFDNNSGEAWPSQGRLASLTGMSVTNVRRAQTWAEREGWLEHLAAGAIGRRGKRYVGLVPSTHSSGSTNGRSTGQNETTNRSVGPFQPVTTDRQTPMNNSHIELPTDEHTAVKEGGLEVASKPVHEFVFKSRQNEHPESAVNRRRQELCKYLNLTTAPSTKIVQGSWREKVNGSGRYIAYGLDELRSLALTDHAGNMFVPLAGIEYRDLYGSGCVQLDAADELAPFITRTIERDIQFAPDFD
jgi:hypothetical protein